jgi:hypothetical protein
VNKKALTAAFIILLLFSMLVGVQFINKAKAETLGPIEMLTPTSSVVEIFSPRNETYNTRSILLNFTVEAYGDIYDVGYSLDGGAVERVSNLTKISEVPAPDYFLPPFVRVTFRGNVLLSNLPRGKHSVTVYQGYQFRGFHERYEVCAYAYANFTIDAITPKILLLSPETKVYNVSDVPLNFAVDEPVSQVTYSLDGQDNVTVIRNATLTGLPNGNHNVTVYAIDQTGNTGTSETIMFTIAKPEPQSEPFPTTLVVAAFGVAVVIVGAGLLVYFKKRKH